MDTPVPLQWHTEKRKINDLKAFDKNPRKLTEQQKQQLVASLQKFNLVEIPAIDVDGKIVAGHQRVSILKALGRGDEEIDLRVPNRPLTDEEFKEYNLRSNKNTGEWDYELLSIFGEDVLKDIGFGDDELALMGFGISDSFELKEGEKEPFQTMTFTLSDDQAREVQNAIDEVKWNSMR